MTRSLRDQPARDRIATALDETLFVEAGAGSGKTRSLVERVLALVESGVPIRHIAAVTFTEKAGAELRDRLRAAFEAVSKRTADAEERRLAEEALDDLDGAAIGTLHAFAQRILTEHPIEAGIPPLVEVLDEVASGIAFEERWSELARALLDDDAVAEPLLLAFAAGVELKHVRSLAKEFNANWDLLRDRVLAGSEPSPPLLDVGWLVAEARRLAAMAEHCTDDDDKLLAELPNVAAWADRLASAPHAPARIEVLRDPPKPWRFGNKKNWSCDVARIKEDGKALVADAKETVARVQNAVLRILARWVARATLDAADARRRDGRLEFHDLLVLSRELLRTDAGVRAALSDRYRRLLLDEFQDTDQIQIELAVRIAGGEAAWADDWRDVHVPPGRLFVVGDPKQSIYRFRRASIATYLEAQERIRSTVRLTTNFRTVAPILYWVNRVFRELIQAETGSQPAYQPLDSFRDAPRGGGPPVVLLGAPAHQGELNADELRQREAADVAAVIERALAERWQVYDERAGRWRGIEPDDIAVLIPARTSLPQLEDALDAAGVPYRAEASSLVYHAQEVRDLLAAARAIDDPSDALALVTALRSPLFGCGDDDLWSWRQAGGSFNLLAPAPDDGGSGAGGDGVPEPAPSRPAPEHPVAEAIAYLRDLHARARWLAPSEVLATLIRDRRMLEAAVEGPTLRDAWRRLRFVVDQARAWSEAEHGGLRAYLKWAAHQGEESSRVAESVLPETDVGTVRVMTIHAAKGLEFPMVVLSGMTSQSRRAGGVQVLWPPEPPGGFELKLASDVQTGDFKAAQPVDEQMDAQERRRLLYVASTRARDHLVVSIHRAHDSNAETNARLVAGTSGCSKGAEPFEATPLRLPPPAPPAPPEPPAPPDWDAWFQRITSVRERAARPSTISASGLEGTEPAVIAEGIDAGLAKGPRDLELPPWSKGRFGTAIGRAVHGALQSVDLATGSGLDDAVAAQTLAEGVLEHAGVVRDLASTALTSEIVRRAGARQHWKETYVGTTLDDGRVLEGFIDLIYREDDGRLVVVDYKTDAVPAAAIDVRVGVYRQQLAGYVRALEDAAGERVARAVLIFLTPAGSVERVLGRDQLPPVSTPGSDPARATRHTP